MDAMGQVQVPILPDSDEVACVKECNQPSIQPFNWNTFCVLEMNPAC